MKLSKDSRHLPTYEECMKCPFVDKCGDGEKCIVINYQHRDRAAEYQEKKKLKLLQTN